MKRGIMHLLPFNLESASSSIADSEMNRGDLTPLVYGFLKILLGTIEDTIGVLKRISCSDMRRKSMHWDFMINSWKRFITFCCRLLFSTVEGSRLLN